MVDLLIPLRHRSHILQPLDVGMFAPLKRDLALKTDKASHLDPGRISRTECTTMYIRSLEKAVTKAMYMYIYTRTVMP